FETQSNRGSRGIEKGRRQKPVRLTTAKSKPRGKAGGAKESSGSFVLLSLVAAVLRCGLCGFVFLLYCFSVLSSFGNNTEASTERASTPPITSSAIEVGTWYFAATSILVPINISTTASP